MNIEITVTLTGDELKNAIEEHIFASPEFSDRLRGKVRVVDVNPTYDTVTDKVTYTALLVNRSFNDIPF